MLLVLPSLGTPSLPNKTSTVSNATSNRHSSLPAALYFSAHHKVRRILTNKTCRFFRQKPSKSLNFNVKCESSHAEDPTSFDWGSEDFDGTEEMDSPWEGSVIYKRNSPISHVEYCTTLERLGLEKLSTETSKSRASSMGLRVTKAVKDYPHGTPVQISIDVTRRKKRLRLDGILRTVITLGCNRCGEPAAESIYSNFSLLLTEDPIEEPEIINIGSIYGDDKSWSPGFGGEEDDDDEASIDMDDRLYFPPEQKEIDISKHIRDLVHLEITINAVCCPSCRGLCLKCGTNLNTSTCNCSNESKVEKKDFGPLGDLKKQMQQS